LIEFDSQIGIERAPAPIFAVLADFERYLARWAKGPVAARRTTGDGGVGTRYTVVARIGLLKARSPYEVQVCEPPVRFGGSGVAGPVRFHEEYLLTEHGSVTLLTQSITARPRGPFRLVEGPLRRQLRSLIQADLGRLKALVEAEVPQQPNG